MKKLAILVCAILCSISSRAQLTVSTGNNIGIGASATQPASLLSVGSNGSSSYEGFFYNPNSSNSYCMGMGCQAVPSTGHSYGLYGIVSLSSSAYGNVNYGVGGFCTSSTALTGGQAYGIYGAAGNATSGWNFGVFGQLAGTNNGAAICGIVPGYTNNGTSVNSVMGTYAGFFLGNVYVQGSLGVNIAPNSAFDITTSRNIQCAGITVNSDSRLKQNIQNFSGALALVNSLQGVTYKLIPNALQTLSTPTSGVVVPDTGNVKANTLPIDTAFYNRSRIGFLAQDVQKIFPQLVYTDKNGLLSVDYVSLIPVLVEANKELNLTVQTLITTVQALSAKVAALSAPPVQEIRN